MPGTPAWRGNAEAGAVLYLIIRSARLTWGEEVKSPLMTPPFWTHQLTAPLAVSCHLALPFGPAALAWKMANLPQPSSPALTARG